MEDVVEDSKSTGDLALEAISNGDLDRAESMLRELLAAGVELKTTLSNLGAVFFFRGDFGEAARWFKDAIAIDPFYAKGHSNLASCLLRIDQPELALQHADIALSIDPNEENANVHRGVALTDLLRHGEALPALLEGLKRTPADVPALVNLARTFRENNQYDEAILWHSRALFLEPSNVEANFSRGLAYLQLGDFANGFAGYEWRWQKDQLKGYLRQFDQPRWVGQLDLKGGTILLYEEQGLGDTIQFARYALALAEQGAKVILSVRPTLRALFACFETVVTVIQDGDALPAFDCHSPLLSLPLALGTTVSTIPAADRYLSAPADRVQSWRQELGPRMRPRIGIVWSGNKEHSNDRARSMTLSAFPIPNPELFEVFSLQHVVRGVDQPILDSMDIRQLGHRFIDMADTAAVLESMDLVITVDTSVAHLSAALGRPTWILLPFNADWRWMCGRDDSPWYPSMRIFKQAKFNDWKSVFDAITEALAEAAGLKNLAALK